MQTHYATKICSNCSVLGVCSGLTVWKAVGNHDRKHRVLRILGAYVGMDRILFS